MYDPSMRVLAVLEFLQSAQQISSQELAHKLEVSPRTVQRYILRLQDMGIPIEGKRGVGGFYRLKAGYRIPPLIFSNEEAMTLVLGLQALENLGLAALAPLAETVRAKIQRVLPNNTRERTKTLEQVLQISASPWVISTNLELLQTVLNAVYEQRVVEFSYIDNKQQSSKRAAFPSHAIHVDGRWYMVAWCELRQAHRVFRFDRIQSLCLLERTFTPLPAIDALEFVRQQMPFRAKLYNVSVWLGAEVNELQSKISVWWSDLVPEADGTRLRCQHSNLEAFGAMLLGLGCEIRIEQPLELLDAIYNIQNRAAKLLEMHQTLFRV